jgi:hypothetical protein
LEIWNDEAILVVEDDRSHKIMKSPLGG